MYLNKWGWFTDFSQKLAHFHKNNYKGNDQPNSHQIPDSWKQWSQNIHNAAGDQYFQDDLKYGFLYCKLTI